MALFQDDESVTSASAICCETEDDSSSNQHNPYSSFVSVYTFFLLMFQTLFQLSDAALNVLFNFFAFLSSLSHISIKFPEALLAQLPKNVRDARLLIGSKRKSLKHYICSPNCHSIYERESCCAIGKNGEVESLRYTYVKFPSHPQLHHRTKCNIQLMKRIKLQSGKISLQPHFVYPYKSLIESLQEMITEKVF